MVPEDSEKKPEQEILSSTHRRYNILTREWVLVSPHRTKRPWQGQKENVPEDSNPAYVADCYLCPGNERAGGNVNRSYQDTFVFQNDFGALLEEGATAGYQDQLLKAEGERGICRVICFSPDHSLTMAEMTVSSLEKVVQTWQQEFRTLGDLPWINNVQIFENKGAVMGCSNPHPHGQIWAQSTIPNEILKRTAAQQEHFAATGRSLMGDYLEQELEKKERIVSMNEHFVCLVPFWAVWPYETMIVPRRHFRSIDEMTTEEIRTFARILSDITIRYDNVFQTSFPYSAGMQQQPTDGGENYAGWHFHYSFYPPLLRSATIKKFMVGYELFANPQRDITAEAAAETLRNVRTKHYKTR